MKYIATHGTRELSLELSPRSDGRFEVRIGDKSYTADLVPVGGKSLYSLLLDGEAFEISVAKGEDFDRVTLRGRELNLRIESEQARHARLVDAAAGPSGPVTVKSVMPGRVVRVLVTVGQEVTAGQSLLILEAMKMENEVRAPSAGPIAELLVSAGQTVAQGAPLIKIG